MDGRALDAAPISGHGQTVARFSDEMSKSVNARPVLPSVSATVSPSPPMLHFPIPHGLLLP